MNIFFESIKRAPQLMWQSVFQPSKAVGFAGESRRNENVFVLSMSLWGALIGGIFAVPHYWLYHDWLGSVTVAVAVAVAGAFAVADTFAFALAVAVAFAFADASAYAFAYAGAFAGAGEGALAGEGESAFALAGVVVMLIGFFLFLWLPSYALSTALAIGGLLWILVVLEELKIIDFDVNWIRIFLRFGLLLFFIVCGGSINAIKSYESILWTAAYFTGFFFTSQFKFIHYNNKFKNKYGKEEIDKNDVTYSRFASAQKSTLLWTSLLVLIIYAFAYFFNVKPDLNTKLTIIAIGFVVMPIFILHIPDSLLCLPIWMAQKRKMIKSYKDTQKLTQAYENSILFKHEMFYIQLPGLYRVITAFAKNPDTSIKGAVERINHLYWFTFQHKQAQKAIAELSRDRDTAHQYIHYLLIEKNLPLIKILAQSNPLAISYLILIGGKYALTESSKLTEQSYEKLKEDGLPEALLSQLRNLKDQPYTDENDFVKAIEDEIESEQTVKYKSFILKSANKAHSYDVLNSGDSLRLFSGLFGRGKKSPVSYPKTKEERLKAAYENMGRLQGYRYNQLISASLEAAYQLLSAKSIKDFYAAAEALRLIDQYPVEIPYMTGLKDMTAQIHEIYNLLKYIETIESFTSKWQWLDAQRKKFQDLAKTVDRDFYEPFREIWASALNNIAAAIEHEINVMQSSAELSVNLVNKSFHVSPDKQPLRFEIRNSGQATALNIKAEFRVDSAELVLASENSIEIASLDSGAVKTISLSVIAAYPLTTAIKGSLIYTDMTAADKTEAFSFIIEAQPAVKEFHRITNPYLPGGALAGHSRLYYGREDAWQFIDTNLIAGDEHNTIVCHGLRRSGKSSLLQRIMARRFTDKRLVPVMLDISGVENERAFYREMAEAIERKTGIKSGMRVQGFSDFKYFLEAIRDKLDQGIIVMLLDEFESFQELVEQNRMAPMVFKNIRYLMQYEDKLIFLFSGTHKLEEMAADYWSIFFNTALYYRVSFLDERSTRKLIQDPVAKELTYDTLAVNQIVKMTNGQPFLTQLICRYVVERLNEKVKSNYAHINDVDAVVEKIIAEGSDNFSNTLWQEAAELERLLLSVVAEEITSKKQESAGFQNIYERVKAITEKYSPQACLDTLESLSGKEILFEKNGRYRFGVNLFMRWAARRWPPLKMREVINAQENR